MADAQLLTIAPAGESEAAGSIICVGCSNVGKTTIFRQLCSRNIQIENLPDSFVEIAVGKIDINGRSYRGVDIPGITSLFGYSEEELLARDLILHEKHAIILQVADAKNLRRDLTLSCELAEVEKPMVLVLNMMDEALQKGIVIDERAIGDCLGVDTVMTIGNEGEGIELVKECLDHPRVPEAQSVYPEYIEKAIAEIQSLPHRNGFLNRGFALQLLVKDSNIREYIESTFLGSDELDWAHQIIEQVNEKPESRLQLEIVQSRVAKAIEIAGHSQKVLPVRKSSFGEKFSRWACHPLYGLPIFLAVMGILYLFVGKFGAEFLADFIQFDLFEGYLIPFTAALLSYVPSQLVHDAFLGTYGLVSIGLTAGLGIVFPIICTFFFAFSILEDSGYLSRVGILLNSVFKKMGLNGKAVLPLFLGFSCVTMASLSVRALDTKKQRIIAILLLWLCVPCSAQLSIFAAILASISLTAVLVICGVITVQVILVGFIAGKLIPGKQANFFAEVHPIRFPNIKFALYKTTIKVKSFLREVIPLFLVASLALFILDKLKVLYYIEEAGKPIVTGLLGLPAKATEVFILSLIRREAGAAFFKTLADAENLTEVQIIVAMVVMTLFVPCVTSMLIVVKEYSLQIAAGISAFVLGYALLVGFVLNKLLILFY